MAGQGVDGGIVIDERWRERTPQPLLQLSRKTNCLQRIQSKLHKRSMQIYSMCFDMRTFSNMQDQPVDNLPHRGGECLTIERRPRPNTWLCSLLYMRLSTLPPIDRV